MCTNWMAMLPNYVSPIKGIAILSSFVQADENTISVTNITFLSSFVQADEDTIYSVKKLLALIGMIF